jgi:hypothetical protein
VWSDSRAGRFHPSRSPSTASVTQRSSKRSHPSKNSSFEQQGRLTPLTSQGVHDWGPPLARLPPSPSLRVVTCSECCFRPPLARGARSTSRCCSVRKTRLRGNIAAPCRNPLLPWVSGSPSRPSSCYR